MIEAVIEGRKKDLGGFEVGRILPFAQHRMVGPFIFLDHIGPAEFKSGHGLDVRPHPHIGLSTVTYLFEGEIIHRDSLGFHESIRPGEVNWMTAGKGIVHSERTHPLRREIGAALHGMQAWVALPDEAEEIAPAFEHYAGKDMPAYEGEGLYARLIAGEAYGAKANVKTNSPLFYVHWEMAADAKAALPRDFPERAAYVVKGAIEVDGERIAAGQMAVLSKTANGIVTALEPSTVMLLGGEPVGPRHIWWNFVSSSKERIEQAKADWKAGRMGLPRGDDKEWIPLPEDASKPVLQEPVSEHPIEAEERAAIDHEQVAREAASGPPPAVETTEDGQPLPVPLPTDDQEGAIAKVQAGS